MQPRHEPRFAVPAVPARYVDRPRLTERLDSSSAPLTVLAAGPGSGKTVLLSAWLQAAQRPAAWISLTRADDAAARFWPLFRDAVRAAGLPVGEVAELWQEPSPSVTPLPERPTVVLDDAHLLTDPGVLDGLDLVVRRAGAALRLVLAARSDPLLSLDTYRTAGQVCELRAADLALTADETRRLLGAHGVTLPERDLSVLIDRTRGWTAGVRLCAMRMEGTPRPAQFVDELALGQGSIGEFLVEEVLNRQPPEVRSLLLETSFLPEVTGRLADAIRGTTGSRDLLDGLARRNSFVVALDPARSRFRYHLLLREVLVNLLAREPVERRRELRRRAAVWEHEHGDVLTGLAHAYASHDRALTAAHLVHGGLATVFADGQRLPLSRLPDADGPRPQDASEGESAEMAVAEAALAAFCEPLDGGGPGAALDRARAAASDDDARLTLDVAALVLGQRSGDLAAVQAAGARLLAGGQASPVLRTAVLLARARALLIGAGSSAATDVLAGAVDGEVSAQLRLEMLAVTAVREAYDTRRRHPDDALARAQTLLAGDPGLHRPAALDLALGMWGYARADHEGAATAAQRALTTAEGNDAGTAAAAAVLLARILVAGGDPWRAQAVLGRATAAADRAGGLLAAATAAEQARIETELGRPHAALALLDPWHGSPWVGRVAGRAARACLVLGEHERAASWLAEVLDDPETDPLRDVPRYVRVDALLCRAELAWRTADEDAARRALQDALDAAGGVIVAPFVEAAAVLADLLDRHPELAARLPVPVGAPPVRPQRPQQPASPGVLSGNAFDRLSERERAVLRLLTTDLSTAEIAGQLFLSTNTVKTHLSSIYRKLGARNRVDAVARARSLELL